MKKILFTLFLVSSLASFLVSSVTPTLSLRYNDITADDFSLDGSVQVIGLEMDLDEGIKAGIDSDGTDSRIYVSNTYGIVGMGMNADGEPQFTVGASYPVLSNFSVNLDYIINNLTNPDGNPDTNTIRLSLGVTF